MNVFVQLQPLIEHELHSRPCIVRDEVAIKAAAALLTLAPLQVFPLPIFAPQTHCRPLAAPQVNPMSLPAKIGPSPSPALSEAVWSCDTKSIYQRLSEHASLLFSSETEEVEFWLSPEADEKIQYGEFPSSSQAYLLGFSHQPQQCFKKAGSLAKTWYSQQARLVMPSSASCPSTH